MNIQNLNLFHRFLAVFSLIAVILALGCDAADENPTNELTQPSSIVGGELESGYPEVGALLMSFGGGGTSFVCTATLIDPSWVLSAAHCVSMGGGMTIPASNVSFYIGQNANNPSTGEVYSVEAVYAHEDYDPDLIINDISLLKLTTPVDSSVATPIPVNTESIAADLEGELAFYVGFGLTSGNTNDSGVKRSASIQIYQIGEIEYTSRYQDTETGICSGDSGGPAIYDFDGSLRVIGVNSTGSATSSADSCIGYYNNTRVDAFAQWVYDKMGLEIPDCNDDIEICSCDDACQGGGECDNAACGTEDCGTTFSCYTSCPTKACESDCLVLATSTALGQMSSLYTCMADQCQDETTTAAYVDCVATSCSSQVSTCLDVTSCNLLGGECGDVQACRPDPNYSLYNMNPFTNCIATDEAGYGAECDISAKDPTSCPDGMTCRAADVGNVCHQLCASSADCTLGGGECKTPAFGAPNNDIGYCDDDFTSVDVDTDADTDADSDADADTDADTDSDTDADTDTDTGDGGDDGDSGDDSCGCSAVGSTRLFGSFLDIILG